MGLGVFSVLRASLFEATNSTLRKRAGRFYRGCPVIWTLFSEKKLDVRGLGSVRVVGGPHLFGGVNFRGTSLDFSHTQSVGQKVTCHLYLSPQHEVPVSTTAFYSHLHR